MNTTIAIVICYTVGIASIVAQPNPDRPDLCQGAYYTEAQGADALHKAAETHNDRASWESRAALIRQGLRAGMQLPDKPAAYAPLSPSATAYGQ
jgi:hypothetical protein